MRKARRSLWGILHRVSELLELLIICHPQGFLYCLEKRPRLSQGSFTIMMNAVLDKLPDNFIPTMPHLEPEKESERIVFYREYFDKSVELAGGWPHIYLVSREFRDSDS